MADVVSRKRHTHRTRIFLRVDLKDSSPFCEHRTITISRHLEQDTTSLKMTTLLADTKSSSSIVNESKISNMSFHCEYPNCQKKYTRRSNLRVHVKCAHKHKRISCEYPDCQKSYSSKRNLEEHVYSHHENQRFRCEYPD